MVAHRGDPQKRPIDGMEGSIVHPNGDQYIGHVMQRTNYADDANGMAALLAGFSIKDVYTKTAGEVQTSSIWVKFKKRPIAKQGATSVCWVSVLGLKF